MLLGSTLRFIKKKKNIFSFGRGLVKASVTLQGKDRDGICPSGVEKI